MMNRRLCVLALATLVLAISRANSANAAPDYSFETALDGFFGLGATVSAENTIGVTDGRTSLKYEIATGGFVGARTETVIPAGLNNPPGVQSVLFDMAIVEIPANLTFADIGISVFGHDIDNGLFGVQSQFTDVVSITGLGVGQHHDLEIALDSEFFSGESFNEIFGDDVGDLDVASSFQFYISKTASARLTVYIDNVRLLVPEPATVALSSLGLCGLIASARRRGRAAAV